MVCPAGGSRGVVLVSRGEVGGGVTARPAKVGGGCRAAGTRAPARRMVLAPAAPLAPLDARKTRALTTIYAPRKLKPRAYRTASSRMLDNIPVKPSLSPFHPLPAIGQKVDERPKTKVIVFDLKKNDCAEKLHDVLKPLTPLRIRGFARKSSLDPLDEKKPQQLIRENTYDVLEPIFVNAAKVKRRDRSLPRRRLEFNSENAEINRDDVKISPKSRFKKAAMQVAKLSSMPETGKLLCLREKETFVNPDIDKGLKLEELPQCPTEKLTELTEIFQSLELRGRHHRDRMKKENSWF